jgi:hypothetical protein
MNDLIPVTMNLSELTIKRVKEIQSISGEENRTRIVVTGIQYLQDAIKAWYRGAKIIIREKDGTEKEIKFIGFKTRNT